MLKKSILSIIGYLILCICLILSLLPVSLSVKALNEISAVEISGVTAPVSGEKPDFDVSVPGGAGYSVQSVVWSDSIGDTDFQHFTGGEKYEIAVTLKADDGSIFKVDEGGLPLVTATVNGQSAGYCKAASGMASDIYAVVYYSYTATEQSKPDHSVINQVSISGLTTPTVGSAPDFTASASTGCTVDSISWMHLNSPSGSGTNMSGSDRFIAGGQYMVTIVLHATGSYSFAPSVSGKLNSTSVTCQSISGKDPAEYMKITHTYSLSQ